MHATRLENPKAKRPKVKDKQLDAMIVEAWKEGWWAEKRSNGHVMCYSPGEEKKLVDVANTPSDHRTVPNTRSTFRRAGLKL